MRVLVADDSPVVRAMLRDGVERLGHTCLLAADGLEAWEVFQREGADVLISDWIMPGIEGPELCRRVRSRGGLPYTYVILLTQLDDKAHALEGLRAGADDYLHKPLNMHDLALRFVVAERITELHRQLAQQDALLRSLAESDPLTGLPNRRRLTGLLHHYAPLARRQGQPLAVSMLDLDHFKLVNDRHGHVVGDEVLRELGRRLLGAFRGEDVVARWGGEEFVVALYGSTKAAAGQRLERMLAEMRQVAFAGAGGEPFSVSFSAGVAEFPLDASTLDDLLRVADIALYNAKASGRARVHLAEPQPSRP